MPSVHGRPLWEVSPLGDLMAESLRPEAALPQGRPLKQRQSDRVLRSLRDNQFPRLFLMCGDHVVHKIVADRIPQAPGIRCHRVCIPANRAREGYDALRIIPTRGDDRHSRGYLIPTEG